MLFIVVRLFIFFCEVFFGFEEDVLLIIISIGLVFVEKVIWLLESLYGVIGIIDNF